ncbi:MAG TPA: RNA 3'-terminal phosphate cyclase, partial [Candidatus Norongarragalinales archaeon]|nr:RNA 3'-terminal phosphate cyclase [Candidatus Norongarragalinales archaeon]
MICIDGSRGEGGGQVLRTSLSLSAVLQKKIRIENIRAGRKKPGLQPQHLACVNALAQICSAKVYGNAIGSTELSFEPGKTEGGHYEFDIKTAGSATLLFQCLLPPLLFAKDPSALTLHGGTDVPFSPPSLFIERVFLPALSRFGADVTLRTVKHGFFPAGGGLLHAKIKPVRALKAVHLENLGKLNRLSATAISANLPDHIVARQKAVLEKKIP